MSNYDPFLGKHNLKKVNDNWRYLSPKIQYEFIHVRKANYSAITLDSTPDISDTDLMRVFLIFLVDMLFLKTKKWRGGNHFSFYH